MAQLLRKRADLLLETVQREIFNICEGILERSSLESAQIGSTLETKLCK